MLIQSNFMETVLETIKYLILFNNIIQYFNLSAKILHTLNNFAETQGSNSMYFVMWCSLAKIH